MSSQVLFGFIAASAILIAIPGPNVAVIVANSFAYGARYGLITVAGTSGAMALQLTLVVAGFSELLSVFASWFEWLRWIGVAYLVFLAVMAFRASPAVIRAAAQPKDAWKMFVRGFFVSLANPKTLFFFGAFFPQFVNESDPGTVVPQLTTLAIAFLAVAVVMDSGWALLAYRVRGRLTAGSRIANRITGSLLLLACAGLALTRRA